MSDTRVRIEPVVPRPERAGDGGFPYEGVRRFVLVVEGGVADFVWMLPSFQSLRAAYPRAWSAIAVPVRCAPLARLVRGCDEVLEDPGTGEGLSELLRRFTPDLVVDTTGGTRVAWAAARAKTTHRAGFTGRFRRALFDRGVDVRRLPADLHRVELALVLARRAGSEGGEPRFGLEPQDALNEATGHWVEAQRMEAPWVLLLPGTDPARASWPPAHFARLALLLRAEGVGVAFALSQVAGSAGRALDEAHVDVRRIPRFHGGIPALAALEAHASAVVGNVSGPVQLAAAWGVPAFSLHPPWAEWSVARTGPYSSKGIGIVVVGDADARTPRSEEARRGAEAMAMISPAAVLGGVLSRL